MSYSKRIGLAASAAALAALTACSTAQATHPPTVAPITSQAPAQGLSTAHLGCQLYIGGSVADANPNVVISVTAGASAVTGEVNSVTVGGPTDTGTVTQALQAGYPVSVQPGQTADLPPIDIGVNSELGNIMAAAGCTVISYEAS